MRELGKLNNPYSDDKVIDACSIFGMMDTRGRKFSGGGGDKSHCQYACSW